MDQNRFKILNLGLGSVPQIWGKVPSSICMRRGEISMRVSAPNPPSHASMDRWLARSWKDSVSALPACYTAGSGHSFATHARTPAIIDIHSFYAYSLSCRHSPTRASEGITETFPSIHSPSPRSPIPQSVIQTPTARWLNHDVAHAGIHAFHAFFTHAVMLPQACIYRHWFALKFARPAPNSSQIGFSICKHMESQGHRVVEWPAAGFFSYIQSPIVCSMAPRNVKHFNANKLGKMDENGCCMEINIEDRNARMHIVMDGRDLEP